MQCGVKEDRGRQRKIWGLTWERKFAQGFDIVTLRLQSCDARHSEPAGYDQHIFSFVSTPKIPTPIINRKLIQSLSDAHIQVMGVLGYECLPGSRFIVLLVAVILLGSVVGTRRARRARRARRTGSSGGRSCRGHSTTLTSTLHPT